MNLNEMRKRAKTNKIISILICCMLVFSIISMNINSSYANPLGAVFYTGEAAFGGLMSAYGMEAMSAENLSTCYESLPPDLQAALAAAGEDAVVISNEYGLAKISLANLSAADWQMLDDWFIENFNTYAGDAAIGAIIPADITNYMGYNTSTNTYALQLNDYYDGLEESKILVYNGNNSYLTAYHCTTIKILFNPTTNLIGFRIIGEYTKRTNYENGIYSETTGNGIADWGVTLAAYKGYFLVMDVNENPIGYFTTGQIVPFNRLAGYGPDEEFPFPVGLTPGIIVPVNDAPDTNVSPPPDNSIDNPITLQTLVTGLNALDGFFDQGNSIILADGTIIGKTNDLVRAEDVPIPDVSSGTVEGDVKGIRSAINAVLVWLSTIAATVGTGIADIISKLSDPFNWEKAPKGPNVISGIGGFFSVLIALLIAIMHLIAKVIAFIGQLYNIPSSSAMLHPTMIQGLEWARGFHTAGGVNLYSLITGIISIVFGVVCFKLLRRIITGVGTSSDYQHEVQYKNFTQF